MICITGEMTIYRAAELKPLLLQALADGDGAPIEIDLAEVSEFDAAGLQLLMAAKTAATAAGRALRLQGHSPAVLDVFELLDVAAFFGDPLLIDSATDAGATA
ncbi:lipid asymmetry maintenance protein MlaB [Aquabacterium sp.]|uniref:STAS domain-containing protein n=1 Tax=Aquabacterium sp. TaxID=1872578 RepID=UPI003784D46F